MNLELIQLLKQKEPTIKTEEDIKKLKVVKMLIQKDGWIFDVNYDVAINILKFLGIPDKQLHTKYLELTSIEKYNEVSIKERDIFKS